MNKSETIEITYNEGVNAYLAINGVAPEVAKQLGVPPLEGIATMRGMPMHEVVLPLKRINDSLVKELGLYEESKDALIREARERLQEEDLSLIVEKDPDFATRLKELDQAKLILHNITKIKLSKIPDGLSVRDLTILDPFINKDG